jgi:hypothetical protein
MQNLMLVRVVRGRLGKLGVRLEGGWGEEIWRLELACRAVEDG